MTSPLSHSINLAIFLFICHRRDETWPSAMARRASVSLPLSFIFIRESFTCYFMDSAARAGQRKSLLILDLAGRRDGGSILFLSLSLFCISCCRNEKEVKADVHQSDFVLVQIKWNAIGTGPTLERERERAREGE